MSAANENTTAVDPPSDVEVVSGQLSDAQKSFLRMAESEGVPRELFGEFVPEIKFQEETPDPSKPTIAYIHTGGTLMMVPSKSDPSALSFEEAIDIPEVMRVCDSICHIRRKFNVVGVYLCNADSKDVGPAEWTPMASTIKALYNKVDGVVVGHGTHTLEFSAAAMSFALRDLAIPIILTASQLPIIGHPGSDGLQNLTGAMQIAARGDLAEVVGFAAGKIHRGTRIVKKDDKKLDVFESRVIDPIGYFVASGDNVELRPGTRRRSGKRKYELKFNPHFSRSVTSITITPGTNPQVIRDIVEHSDTTRRDVGLILGVYGSGAIPKEAVPILASHYRKGYPVYLTSTCSDSGASADMQGHDEDAKAAYESGVRVANDMTTTAAVAKLMSVQALLPEDAFTTPTERLAAIEEEMLRKNYAGEIQLADQRMREDY